MERSYEYQIKEWSTTGEEKSIAFGYSRRTNNAITLLKGDYILQIEDNKIDVSGDTLLLTSLNIPIGMIPVSKKREGIIFLFADSYITKNNSGYNLKELPVFKLGQHHIYRLSSKAKLNLKEIFNKITALQDAPHTFKEQLMRLYLLEVIFHVQNLTPEFSFKTKYNTAEKITYSFMGLLESQFPIESVTQRLQLKTAKDFAAQLFLHPNYINRQVKAITGKTVTDLIAARVLKEAKILLKLTNWHINEISWSLGFEEPPHFNLFFKTHTHISPTDFRKSEV